MELQINLDYNSDTESSGDNDTEQKDVRNYSCMKYAENITKIVEKIRHCFLFLTLFPGTVLFVSCA